MHPNAYEPGKMVYAYIKAQSERETRRWLIDKGIRLSHVPKVVEIKPGELYMAHVVGYFGVISDWFHELGVSAPYPFGACLLYRTE